MSYSLEFIKNLPASMQTEISNLNGQILALESKKSELQLPVDVVISYETVTQNQVEAAKILSDAKAEAQALLDSALVASSQTAAEAKQTVDNLTSQAEQTLVLAKNTKRSAEDYKSQLDEREDVISEREKTFAKLEADHTAKAKAFKQKVQAVITALD